ncbi:MAG: hypothetical protein NT011_11595 [Kiritimatiellaeota bacterium]|nr:hypothetical protein [Kiritimatiellota bacterium]
MKLGIWNRRKITAIALSAGLVILTAMSVWAQEQKDPFEKNQGSKTAIVAQSEESEIKPSIISVELRMIEMPRLAADEVFKEQGGIAKTYVINEKTLGIISAMVTKNKAKVVGQAQIQAQDGSDSTVKSAQEIIYSTEYANEYLITQGIGTNNAGGTTGIETRSAVIIPSAFETRDIGTILNVRPTVAPDNKLINLAILPQVVRLSAHPYKSGISWSTGKTECEQPKFMSYDLTTDIDVPDGKPVLLGVCDAIEDQEMPEKVRENIVLWIVTATNNILN